MQGHIHKRVHRCRDGRETVRWYVVVDVERGPDGRRRQKWHGGFRTRRQAEVARARVVTALHDNRYVTPGNQTLAEWVLEQWLPTIKMRIKPTTYSSYRQIMKSHVLPVLGRRPIQQLKPAELEKLYLTLLNDAQLSVSTVDNVHRGIHKALTDAQQARLLVDNPAASAMAPRPWRTERRVPAVWSAAELARFLDAVRNDPFAAIWRLSAMTGMRRGEVLALRWSDLNLRRSRLAVTRAVVEVDSRVMESAAKFRSSRVIDLDAETVRELARHRDTQLIDQNEWGNDYQDADLVVAKQDGSGVRPGAFTTMFHGLLATSGIRRIRLHDLRHTHATLALQAGVPVSVISERLGHASPGFTLAQYAHAVPGMQAMAAARVANLVRRSAIGNGRSGTGCRASPIPRSP